MLPLAKVAGGYLRVYFNGAAGIAGTQVQTFDLTQVYPEDIRGDRLFRTSLLIFARAITMGVEVDTNVSFLPADPALPAEQLQLTITAAAVTDEVELDIWLLHSVLGAPTDSSKLYFISTPGAGGNSLQQAYNAGPPIAVSETLGAVSIAENGGDPPAATTELVDLTRVSAGPALRIDKTGTFVVDDFSILLDAPGLNLIGSHAATAGSGLDGGLIALWGGQGDGAGGGGSVSFYGGTPGVTGTGGTSQLVGGAGGTTSGDGGNGRITAGSATDGNGGGILLWAGDGGTNGNGGILFLRPGNLAGGGNSGYVQIQRSALVFSRLTTAIRDALVLTAGAGGGTIFNTTTSQHEFWDGAAWVPLGSTLQTAYNKGPAVVLTDTLGRIGLSSDGGDPVTTSLLSLDGTNLANDAAALDISRPVIDPTTDFAIRLSDTTLNIIGVPDAAVVDATGGGLLMRSAAGDGTGNGGILQLLAGNADPTGSGTGGDASFSAGNGGLTGDGGTMAIASGGATTGDGGSLTLSTGASSVDGNGGDLNVVAGDGAGAGDGGNIFFIPGTAGAGNPGTVGLRPNVAAVVNDHAYDQVDRHLASRGVLATLGVAVVTTAERNALTAPADTCLIVWNSTTGQLEANPAGAGWSAV